ncbi:MAG: hypothetical protein AB1772_06805 [Candidatus Zixiibacteriota bacterium]
MRKAATAREYIVQFYFRRLRERFYCFGDATKIERVASANSGT